MRNLLSKVLLATGTAFLAAVLALVLAVEYRRTQVEGWAAWARTGEFYFAQPPDGFTLSPQTQLVLAALIGRGEAAALYRWERPGLREHRAEAMVAQVSPSWLRLAAPLRAGRLPATPQEALAPEGGPYRLGERVGSFTVVGLVGAVPWRRDPDDVLVQPVETVEARVEQLVAASAPARERLQAALAGEEGPGLEWRSGLGLFWDLGGYSLQSRSLLLRVFLACGLFTLAVLGILGSLRAHWHRQQDTYRLERALGLTRRELERRWLLSALPHWALPTGLALLAALAYAASSHSLYALPSVLPLAAGLLAVGFTATALLVREASRFSLARASGETRENWRDAVQPVLLVACIAGGGAFVLGKTLERWEEGARFVGRIGADRVDVSPSVGLARPFDERSCARLGLPQVRECGYYVRLGAPLSVGGRVFWNLDRVVLLDAGLIRAARLELAQGRWPVGGQRELALSESAWRQLRPAGLALGGEVAFNANLRWRVVGVVRDYQGPDRPRFVADAYAGLGDPFLSRLPRVPPLGSSGLVLRVAGDAEALAPVLRERLGRQVGIARPAGFALALKAQAERDLRDVVVFVILALAVAAQVFVASLRQLVRQRFAEIAVWRLLGLERSRTRLWVFARFWRFPGAVLAGLVSLALSAWALGWVSGAQVATLALLGAVLLLLSWGAVHLVLREELALSPAELFAKASQE